ncbi:MAG: ribonuclease H-like YkuK family protein [Deltaproteobacteria bacterium]|nr:ribonuclease H-like YkuK family protein [Deltaproteobacteria bacterium]MBI3754979.1 ribonuclease H-like YkuK family protein [Deltaproteobacteria bacterium]
MESEQPVKHQKKEFFSPTFGNLSFEDVFSKLVEYIEEDTSYRYSIIVGTDSFLAAETIFISAIIIHRIGHGGRYFYKKIRHRKLENLRQRIFYETSLSLEMAAILKNKLSENGFAKLPVEIHLDVGDNGDTKEIVREVVGMVTGSGYAAVTKPNAYGASKVADRHSK